MVPVNDMPKICKYKTQMFKQNFLKEIFEEMFKQNFLKKIFETFLKLKYF